MLVNLVLLGIIYGLSISNKPITVTGFSGGGYMATLLGMAYPNLFDNIVTFSGGAPCITEMIPTR